MSNTSPIFVTWYTYGYKHYADKLMDSMKKLGIPIFALESESKGPWIDNLVLKSEMINHLIQNNDPDMKVVWIDADIEVAKYPQFLFDIPDEIDFSAHKYTDDKSRINGRLYSSAIMYFKIGKPTRNLVQQWLLQHKQNRGLLKSEDGENALREVIKPMLYAETIRVLDLPDEYYRTESRRLPDDVIQIKDSRHLHMYQA